MKYTVVNSSRLGTGCWLPERFTGGYWRCGLVDHCKQNEAVAGRAIKSLRKLSTAMEKAAVYAEDAAIACMKFGRACDGMAEKE